MILFGLIYLIGCTEDNDISNKPVEESIILDVDGDRCESRGRSLGSL